MLDVYLVDDEIMSIEYFKSLFAQSDAGVHARIAGWNTNAAGALRDIIRIKPHIIFIDIIMPGMTGLELSEQIFKHIPKAKIILLTAHKDFEYVLTGLQMGVFDYLIKHEISPERIADEIEKIGQVLQQEQQGSYLEQKENLRKLLAAQSNPDEVPWKNESYLKGAELILLAKDECLFLADGLRPTGHVPAPGASEMLELVPGCSSVLAQLDDNHWACVIDVSEQPGEQQIQTRGLAVARELQNLFEQKGVSVSCILDGPLYGAAQLRVACSEMKKKAERLFFHGRKNLLFAYEINAGESQTDSRFIPQMGDFLQTGRTEEALQLLHAEIEKGTVAYSFEQFQAQLKKTSVLLRHYLQKNRITLPERGESGFNSARQAEEYLEQLLQLLHKPSSRTGSSVIQRYLYYAQNALADPGFSVAVMAEACHVSERYLRNLFREELGITPSVYITRLRIEAAIQRMRQGGCVVSELYREVGFSSNTYFIQVFKKETGKTPAQYYRRL